MLELTVAQSPIALPSAGCITAVGLIAAIFFPTAAATPEVLLTA